MVPCTNRSYDKYSPLILSSTAEGHSRPVLSVSLTDDVMFSGSKDCTVKIWDLHTGREIQSLEDHPDSVVKVVYNEYIRLAFSVSKSIIKVWDTRENPARCIKILKYEKSIFFYCFFILSHFLPCFYFLSKKKQFSDSLLIFSK